MFANIKLTKTVGTTTMTTLLISHSGASKNTQANQVDRLSAPTHITHALRQASASTGISFAYLVQKAGQESSFNSNATSSTSSATGLFQFTKNTWLHMIKEHGADYGLEQLSEKITTDKNGRLQVTDATAKQAILDLRKDPTISAAMAGEYDKENLVHLKKSVGGTIGSTELYLAHFLGAGGASDFISTLRDTPNTSAAAILPNAADANRSVFYNKDGSEKSVTEIYQHFAKKFDNSQPVHVATATQSTIRPTSDIRAINVAALSGSASYDYSNPLRENDAPRTTEWLLPTSQTSTVVGDTTPTTSSLFATMVLAQMNMHAPTLTNKPKKDSDSYAA